MTLLKQIENQLRQLPPEKQNEVLDFIVFLRQRLAALAQTAPRRSLRQHPAFGSWRGRNIDALACQNQLRAEWDARPPQGAGAWGKTSGVGNGV
jgi:hypothetical protein